MQSDTALRAAFAGFEGAFVLDHPADPFSDAYRHFQMGLYERFARRKYTLVNEATPFDVDASVTRPFPFSSASPVTAGQHLGAVSFLLRCLRLQPGARILEFGPGWGNTTIALAQLGFAVTAVDIDPKFCDLLRRRAAQQSVAIDVVNADFLWVEQVERSFDAIIFFECFHHCADHLRLLAALHNAAHPETLVYFGAEPILPDYPIPWGLRMDGEALWAIGTHGWLELGFREAYFRSALNRTGWTGRLSRSADLPWISVWEASAQSDRELVIQASDARLGTIIGRRSGPHIVVAAEYDGFALYGPHIPLASGHYRATIRFAPATNIRGILTMDVCCERGVTILATAPIDPRAAHTARQANVRFSLADQVDEIEVRLFARLGGEVTIESVAIERVAKG